MCAPVRRKVKNTACSAATPEASTTACSPPSSAASFSCRYSWLAPDLRVYRTVSVLDQLIEDGSSGSSYEIAMTIRPLIAPDCLGVDTVPAAHSPGRERGLEGMAVVRGCSGARLQ